MACGSASIVLSPWINRGRWLETWFILNVCVLESFIVCSPRFSLLLASVSEEEVADDAPCDQSIWDGSMVPLLACSRMPFALCPAFDEETRWTLLCWCSIVFFRRRPLSFTVCFRSTLPTARGILV